MASRGSIGGMVWHLGALEDAHAVDPVVAGELMVLTKSLLHVTKIGEVDNHAGIELEVDRLSRGWSVVRLDGETAEHGLNFEGRGLKTVPAGDDDALDGRRALDTEPATTWNERHGVRVTGRALEGLSVAHVLCKKLVDEQLVRVGPRAGNLR